MWYSDSFRHIFRCSEWDQVFAPNHKVIVRWYRLRLKYSPTTSIMEMLTSLALLCHTTDIHAVFPVRNLQPPPLPAKLTSISRMYWKAWFHASKHKEDHKAEHVHHIKPKRIIKSDQEQSRGYNFPRLRSWGEAYYVTNGGKTTCITAVRVKNNSQSSPISCAYVKYTVLPRPIIFFYIELVSTLSSIQSCKPWYLLRCHSNTLILVVLHCLLDLNDAARKVKVISIFNIQDDLSKP